MNKIPVFLDLKFNDIPNTVGEAVKCFSKYQNIKYMTVHISGGENMVKEAINNSGHIGIIGVTVLTSIKRTSNTDDKVWNMAVDAYDWGCKGIVCSVQELPFVNKPPLNNMIFMVPGIRPEWSQSQTDDQRRIGTPKNAVNKGASYIIIGRPILNHDNPVDAVNLILDELEEEKQDVT